MMHHPLVAKAIRELNRAKAEARWPTKAARDAYADNQIKGVVDHLNKVAAENKALVAAGKHPNHPHMKK